MSIKTRLDKLEAMTPVQHHEYHIEYPGERCGCDKCQTMTSEEYSAFKDVDNPNVTWVVVEYEEHI